MDKQLIITLFFDSIKTTIEEAQNKAKTLYQSYHDRSLLANRSAYCRG